jgi:glycosyltransferase involved in cell wall biosynthesis
MSKKTLHQLYAEHTGKVSDKWSLYLTEYDRLFSDYRDKPIRLLEIGVQNGGSLEIWSKYFSNASALIGCDINPDCARLSFDDPRIGVIVGDANAPEVCEQVFQCSPQFDIIINNGSHLSSDIIKSFALYFPRVVEGGVFTAEGTNCSYWGQFEGGLFDPYSSISFFKRLADVISHEHWGISKARADILRGIFTKYGCKIDEEVLTRIHSVEFINSMCVVRKAPAADNGLGHRVIAGSTEPVVPGHLGLHGSPYQLMYDQSDNPWTARTTPPDEAIQHAELSLAERDGQIAALYHSTMKASAAHARATVVVIIPFYNGSKFIERSVRSVLDQTVPADEFIVVNDGSKEEEQAFLYELTERYPFKILNKENGGQGSARNAGVAASTSEFICFLDQDDYYLENHIEILTKSLPHDDKHVGFVYADLHRADCDGNLVFAGIVKESSPPNPKRSLTDLLSKDMHVLPSASIIKRKAFEAVGGFDPQLMGYEDDDLFLRIFHKGYTNYYVDRPVTVWRANGESTSYSVRMSRSRFRYFKKLVSAFPDNPDLGLSFFRDYIVPRFSRLFIIESIRAAMSELDYRREDNDILREYVSIVCANRNVTMSCKVRLRLTAFVLTSFPTWFLRICQKTARFAIVRSLMFP